MKSSLNCKLVLFLLFFALLRIIAYYFIGLKEIPSWSDAVAYDAYALAILNQPDWLTNPDFYGDSRPPGFAMFLAFIYSIFGVKNLIAVYFFLISLSVATTYYIFKLSVSIFGEERSFLAFLWSGFYFFYVSYSVMLARESVSIFLIIFSFYHLWIFLNQEGKKNSLRNLDLWKFIIAFMILLHTDARYLFYIPFLIILFVIYREFWEGVKQYFWVLCILILMLAPWTIRNYFAYNGFVLINTRTLDTREDSVSMRFKLLSTEKITRTFKTPHFPANSDYPDEAERTLIKEGLNPCNRSDEEIRLIMKNVYPASTFLGRKLYSMIDMWVPFRFWSDYRPFPDGRLREPWSLRHNIISILFYGLLLPFVLIAVFLLLKEGNKAVWFLVFPVLIQGLLHFLMFGLDRYRVPIDSFIIILGCYGIQMTREVVEKRRKNTIVPTVLGLQ